MKNLLLIVFFLLVYSARSQYEPLAKNAFLGEGIQASFDYWSISKPNLSFHSSFRPYLSSTFLNASDSAVPFNFYAFRNFFFSKTFNEKPEKRNWFNFQLHPLLDIEPAYDLLTERPVLSVLGGTHVKMNINNDFTFAASLYGGKMEFPFFLDTSIKQQRIIPQYGQGYKAQGGGYSFFDFTGYISYTTKNKVFNLQAGRDKHFIGDGYRSVLLSDFAPAYPYFRINTNIWRLQYSVWYAWMNDVSSAKGIKQNFTNKYGTFHYLSYNVVKQLNIGLFENVIWRGTDTNQVRTFEVNYLNPIIFYRPQEYSIGSPDNSFLGLNINLVVLKKIKLYGQIGLDEFYLKELRARKGWWANKQAWQFGAKCINALGIKGLKLQAEYNQARPYTYTHGLVDQNYSHYGAPLAHPFGANFKEAQGIITYRKKSWELFFQGMYAIIGKDTAGTSTNMGQNIFRSYLSRPYEYGHYTTQGEKHNVMQSHVKFTYYIIPDMNLRLELGYIQRSEQVKARYQLQNPYLYLAFKTSFWNIYKDF